MPKTIVNRIKLPCYGIDVMLFDDDTVTVMSDLEDDAETIGFIERMETIERFVGAVAQQGIDIESPAFLAAIETVVQEST
jgi:hypothetical protein